jgi:type II secretory pathway pseudopilin PulG
VGSGKTHWKVKKAVLSDSGRTILENLLTIILVSFLLGFFAIYIEKTTKVAREYTLISELANIRSSIEVYAAINRKFPNSLNQLLEKQLILPFKDFKILKKDLLKNISVDEHGNPLDPFGNKFGYNPKSGYVWTTTTSYGGW